MRRERVGFIFQAFNLVPTLSAEENIRLPLLLGNKTGDAEWIKKSSILLASLIGFRIAQANYQVDNNNELPLREP